jgi:hypothetical protein
MKKARTAQEAIDFMCRPYSSEEERRQHVHGLRLARAAEALDRYSYALECGDPERLEEALDALHRAEAALQGPDT